MRFFVPLAQDPDHGEHLYMLLRARLANIREPPTEQRIYFLKFQQLGKCHTIAIGGNCDLFADGPVIAIFQGGATSTYYVCTPKHGVFEGEPYPIRGDECISIEEFSALR